MSRLDNYECGLATAYITRTGDAATVHTQNGGRPIEETTHHATSPLLVCLLTVVLHPVTSYYHTGTVVGMGTRCTLGFRVL